MKRNCIEYIKIILEIAVIIILAWTLYYTHQQIQINKQIEKYRYLAGVWNDIMKESIQHPNFNDKFKTSNYKKVFSGEERIKYDIYARWVGGFIEDLYYNKYYNKDLYYEPWIKSILEVHRSWFTDHADFYKYTDKMYNRILSLDKNSGSLEQ